MALAGGDLVVIPRGTGHSLADSPATKARPLAEMAGPRAGEGGCIVMRGGGEGAETRLVCGSFRFERFQQGLPPPLRHPARRVPEARRRLTAAVAVSQGVATTGSSTALAWPGAW